MNGADSLQDILQALLRPTALLELGLPSADCDAARVRERFKQVVVHVHPDKRGGSSVAFQRLKEAFEVVMEAVQLRTNPVTHEAVERKHQERGDESQSIRGEHGKQQRGQFFHTAQGRFDVEVFNRTFEETYVPDEEAQISGLDALRSTDPAVRPPPQKQVVQYQEPTSAWTSVCASAASRQLCELGGLASSFSCPAFTDLREAYTQPDALPAYEEDSAAFDDRVKRFRKSRSVAVVEAPEDRDRFLQYQRRQQEVEQQRQDRLRQRDVVMLERHQRLTDRLTFAQSR